MSDLRIGTCSWKYPSWAGIIYSAEKGINYLSEYAAHYNTVEIDQWFWSLFDEDKVVLPQQSVVTEYAHSVGEDFLFTIKVPNSITLTHFYNRGKQESLRENPYFLSHELCMRFIETLSPLKEKIGLLIFQFEYLNKKKMSSVTDFITKFTEFRKKLPGIYRYGVEIRNPNYLDHRFFSFLRMEDLVPVFIQGYYMPDIFPLYNTNKDNIRGTVVVRLHGPRRKEMEKATNEVWNKIVANKDKEIDSLIDMIDDLKQKNIDIFINVNNHYEGSAPLTIQKIYNRLNSGRQ